MNWRIRLASAKKGVEVEAELFTLVFKIKAISSSMLNLKMTLAKLNKYEDCVSKYKILNKYWNCVSRYQIRDILWKYPFPAFMVNWLYICEMRGFSRTTKEDQIEQVLEHILQHKLIREEQILLLAMRSETRLITMRSKPDYVEFVLL